MRGDIDAIGGASDAARAAACEEAASLTAAMDEATATFATILGRVSVEHAELLPWAARLANFAAVNSGELGELIGRSPEKLGAPLEALIAEEDNVLFPAYAREIGDGALLDQFRREHRELVALRDQLFAAFRDRAPPPMLGGIAGRLADLLISHMTQEDAMLLPLARQAFDGRGSILE